MEVGKQVIDSRKITRFVSSSPDLKHCIEPHLNMDSASSRVAISLKRVKFPSGKLFIYKVFTNSNPRPIP